MKLALFDAHRLGVVTDDRIVDVTDALPWAQDPDPLTRHWPWEAGLDELLRRALHDPLPSAA